MIDMTLKGRGKPRGLSGNIPYLFKAAFDSAGTVALLDPGKEPDNAAEGTGTGETVE